MDMQEGASLSGSAQQASVIQHTGAAVTALERGSQLNERNHVLWWLSGGTLGSTILAGLGGYTPALTMLCGLVLADVLLAGLLILAGKRKFDALKAREGMALKISYFIMIWAAGLLAKGLGVDGSFVSFSVAGKEFALSFQTLFIVYPSVLEFASLIHNAGLCGYRVPNAVRTFISTLLGFLKNGKTGGNSE